MTLVNSTMMPLGTKAPDFVLPDVQSGKSIHIQQFYDKPLLVIFLCRHCPYVKHIQHELVQIGNDYRDTVHIVGISSNDAESYPEDSPASLAEMARELAMPFPIVFDKSQEVAQSYTAMCTPDVFLFDRQQRLVYRGQIDSSRPGNTIPITGNDLRDALDAVVSGRSIDVDQKPSSGCNIKWLPGNEPAYMKDA